MPDGRVIACSVARFLAEVSQRVIRATRRDEERANVTQGMIHRTLAGPLALYDARVGAAAQQLESYSPGGFWSAAEQIAGVEQDMQATIDRRLRALERDPEFLEEDLANAMARRLDALDRALAPEAGALDPRSPLRVLTSSPRRVRRGEAVQRSLAPDQPAGALLVVNCSRQTWRKHFVSFLLPSLREDDRPAINLRNRDPTLTQKMRPGFGGMARETRSPCCGNKVFTVG